MNRITFVLTDDHDIVREGLRVLLGFHRDLEIVGQATNGQQAVALAADLRPSVIVIDIAMPLLNGFDATREILARVPETKVLVLSAYSDDEFVVRMAEMGAAGYVVKRNAGEVLVNAVREVANGRSYISPAIERRLENAARKAWENPSASGRLRAELTAREKEVLRRVAQGASNKQLASGLGISIKTVEKHRQRLMDKLDIHDTAGLTRYAIETGAVPVHPSR